MTTYQHTTGPEATSQRLRDYLAGMFPQLPSAKSIRKAIRLGHILVDGTVVASDYRLQAGQLIRFAPPANNRPVLKLPLPILYEDDHLALINKPSGIAVSGNRNRTVDRALPYNLRPHPSGQLPMPVHRLDGPTSGVLLVAKDMPTRIALGQLFAERKIEKHYLAIVTGTPPAAGDLQSPIESKAARTTFVKEQSWLHPRWGDLSLLRCQIHTGRTHQIRRHLAEAGHPIFGDDAYGEVTDFRGSLFLHAERLGFQHPVTGAAMDVSAPLPRRWQRVL